MRRLEVPSLHAGELLAAQARVAEDHDDREISSDGERAVADGGRARCRAQMIWQCMRRR